MVKESWPRLGVADPAFDQCRIRMNALSDRSHPIIRLKLNLEPCTLEVCCQKLGPIPISHFLYLAILCAWMNMFSRISKSHRLNPSVIFVHEGSCNEKVLRLTFCSETYPIPRSYLPKRSDSNKAPPLAQSPDRFVTPSSSCISALASWAAR